MIRKTAADTKKRSSIVEEGIEIAPIPITAGETLTIRYDGMLAKSGAEKVYTHLGYGSSNQWLDIQDIPMKNTKKGWTCETSAKEQRINFCFHDAADNWDNNNGLNWSVTVHNGDM